MAAISPPINTSAPSSLNDYDKVDKMIDNWKTILSSYRKQTGDLTSAFETELKQYNEVVNSFSEFRTKQNDHSKAGVGIQATLQGSVGTIQAILFVLNLVRLLNVGNVLNPMMFVELAVRVVQQVLFLSIQSDIRIYCDMYTKNWNSFGNYGNNICGDFADNKWNDFKNFFTNACQIKISFDKVSSNKEEVKTFYGMLCSSGAPIDVNKYPNNAVEKSGTDQTLFQFLRSNKSYVTFGSQAVTSLTWTSTVTNAVSHMTKFSNNLDNEIAPEGQFSANVGAELKSKIGFKMSTSTKVDVGQVSSQNEMTTRTVTVNLGDADQGTLF